MNVIGNYLEVTSRCNLSCSHCLRGDASKTDLPLEVIIGALNKLPFANQIHLGGGEALLHPQIDEIIEHASKKILILYSNGKFLQEKGMSVGDIKDKFASWLLQHPMFRKDNSFMIFGTDRFHDEQFEKRGLIPVSQIQHDLMDMSRNVYFSGGETLSFLGKSESLNGFSPKFPPKTYFNFINSL